MGALHPILFFAGVYIVALFFSIFICSSLFYSCNTSGSTASVKEQKTVPAKQEMPVTASVVLR
jgi:hypothetical protein